MTAATRLGGGELLARTLYDVAQLLESADEADERVRRVLELLRAIVPYDQCALLEAGIGREPRAVLVPDALLDGGTPLLGTLLDLFGQLVDANPPTPAASPRALGGHLAVPLVGLDEVIGLLFVQSSSGYGEEHLRALSVVAAELAGYLTMLRGRAELMAMVRQRDDARRAVEAANRAKGELLVLLSAELRAPLEAILGSVRGLRSTGHDLSEHTQTIDELERTVRTHAALVDDLLARARTAAREPRSSNVDQSRPPETHGGEQKLAGIRVLLVEHDLGIRESVEAVLAHQGAEVTAVGTVPKALAAVESPRPDVLLVGDLPIHGESVQALMREVVARACPLPVGSISAWRFEERPPERAVGFQLYLAKPFEVEALVNAVAELAGRTKENGLRRRLA
jgi:CheY-like chemotaxis protein